MPNPHPVQNDLLKKCQYKAQEDTPSEPLEKENTRVKVPVYVAKAIRKLPNQAAWLRRVITEAAIREGLVQSFDSE